MRALLLRLDAPLVSFGAPAIDQNGVVQRFPALSMLVGMVANALGWSHGDSARLNELQDRVRFAARIDRAGEELIDYQTVDLGQPSMLPEKAGWTTRGRIASREGSAHRGTHIRFRSYRADSVHTVALSLVGDGSPTLSDVEQALREPARPLFIGRKCCLPATPLLLGTVEAPTLLAALLATPRVTRSDSGPLAATWWDDSTDAGFVGESRVVAVTDERDWHSRMHVGRRFMQEGIIDPPPMVNHA